MRPLVTVLFALAAASAIAAPTDLSAGNLKVSFEPYEGLRIAVRDTPITRISRVQLVRPGWKGDFLKQDNITPVIATADENGAKTLTATYATWAAWARYRIEVRPDDTVKATLAYRTKVEPAELEWNAALLNGNVLAGAPFKADTVEGPREGTVPLFAATPDQWKSRLCPNVKRVSFDTALGGIDISVNGSNSQNGAFMLFDARASNWDWAQPNPVFWFGLGVPQIAPADGEQSVMVTYRFRVAPLPSASSAATATISPVAFAQRPYYPDLPVIPHPKEQTAGAQPCRVKAPIIVIPASPSLEERAAARELAAEFAEYWGISAKVLRGAVKSAVGGAPVIDLRRAADVAGVPARTEGYLMRVRPRRVSILGRDGRGVYYGVQTLKQLIRRDATGVFLKPATIRDWPTLGMRGVHWFGGPDSWAFHKPMIERVIAPLKMNTMLYEASFTQWDSMPKVWVPEYSTPKSVVRRTVALAKAHLLDAIPMVETLGHCDWLFENGQNVDLAADPAFPKAYNPENPRVYGVLFPVMQEAIDLFKPKTFHIGHDEVLMYGRFPGPGMKGTAADLYVADVKKLHDWLAAKGLKTMLWGDQMLHAPEDTNDAAWADSAAGAVARRNGLPKDIIVADWHYQSDSPEFTSVDVFQKAGFQDVVGTTWYEPDNIRNFSKVVADKNANGLLQSTWAGYAVSKDTVDGGAIAQCVAYVLAAECAWNGGDKTFAGSLKPEDVFEWLWNRRRQPSGPRPGFAVTLGNAGLAETTLGLLPTGIPAGRHDFAGVAFEIAKPIVLAGVLEPASRPRTLSIPLGGRTVTDLHLLWGTPLIAGQGTQVARVIVRYKDGKSTETPVRYGREITSFSDPRPDKNSVVVWRGATGAGHPASVRRWTWTNPRPTAPVVDVQVVSDITEAAPAILAITGIR